jgi:microcystin-dependent protein
MARINLEDNLARRIRHASTMFSTVETTLGGSYVIARDGPTFHFLSTSSLPRTVFLPPIESMGGQFYIIANQGPNIISVVDAIGIAQRDIQSGTSAICISSNQAWHILPLSDTGGTGFQPLDADLTSLSAAAADSAIYYRGPGSIWNPVTIGSGLSFVSGTLAASGGGAGGIPEAPTDSNTYARQNANWVDLALGTTYQPLDADLTSLSSAAAVNAMFYRVSAGSWGPVTIGAGLTFAAGTLAATGGIPEPPNDSTLYGRVTTAGTSSWAAAQPVDADLTALAALSGTNDIYFRSGTAAWSPVTIGAGLAFSGGVLSNAAAAATTGDVKYTIKTVADAGWIMMDDGTIGNASSSASTRANADTEALFTLLWNNTTQTNCPVSGGRGASAAADFAAPANKTIRLPQVRSRALGIAGAGAGLTSRALAQSVGSETHTQTVAEMPNHAHTSPAHFHTSPVHSHTTDNIRIGGANANILFDGPHSIESGGIAAGVEVTIDPTAVTINATGGGAAMNIMNPMTFLNMMIKL